MAGLSDFLEAKLLDHVLRNVSYTPPSAVYVSLHTTDPTDVGTGTEVSGGAYTRQTATFSAAVTSGGVTSIKNSADITFPQATANWGTVTHIGIWDAATTGNLLFSGVLSTSKTVSSGDVFSLLANNVTVSLD